MSVIYNLISWMSVVEHQLPIPEDSTQLMKWVESADDLIDELECENSQTIANQILAIYEQHHIDRLSVPIRDATISDELYTRMDELCNRPQIEQRTDAWYEQIKAVLGASELEDVFASDRVRAQLVMSKANPQQRPAQSLATFSVRMSAFDWGIRFEPVVKQIYEAMYCADIKELGRLHSSADNRLTASPDGLVYSSNCGKGGRLLEIKCPVTREPNGIIPKKYYTQMQSQLFVSGLKICDFVEAVFISAYSTDTHRCGPGTYYGEILLIETELDGGRVQYSYMYGPLNKETEYNPTDLMPNQTIVERIPWRLYSWHEQVVRADSKWWTKVKPAVDRFWDDVACAKRGEFVVPESSRARVKKADPCLIVIKHV